MDYATIKNDKGLTQYQEDLLTLEGLTHEDMEHPDFHAGRKVKQLLNSLDTSGDIRPQWAACKESDLLFCDLYNGIATISSNNDANARFAVGFDFEGFLRRFPMPLYKTGLDAVPCPELKALLSSVGGAA